MKNNEMFSLRTLCMALAAAYSFTAYAETAATGTTTSTALAQPVQTTTTTTSVQPAQTTSTTTLAQPVQTTSSPSSTSQTSRIAGQYTQWAGSTSNAANLVTGLRSGSPITLESSGGTLPETTTFTSPTSKMGWGNVTKALSLARAELADIGISNPTPSQLQAALVGGNITVTQGTATETTHLDGVLTMRSQGMGWGEIAHKLDLNPGEVFKPTSAGSQARTATASREPRTLKQEHHAELEEEHDHEHALPTNKGTTSGSSRVTTAAGGTTSRGSSSHSDGRHAELEKEHHLEHRANFASGAAASGNSRVTTAAGVTTATGKSSEPHEHGYASSHSTHATISRVVTASGAPVGSYASYHDAGHGDMHAAESYASRATTAAGGSVSYGGGHGGEHGGGLTHGKD